MALIRRRDQRRVEDGLLFRDLVARVVIAPDGHRDMRGCQREAALSAPCKDPESPQRHRVPRGHSQCLHFSIRGHRQNRRGPHYRCRLLRWRQYLRHVVSPTLIRRRAAARRVGAVRASEASSANTSNDGRSYRRSRPIAKSADALDCARELGLPLGSCPVTYQSSPASDDDTLEIASTVTAPTVRS